QSPSVYGRQLPRDLHSFPTRRSSDLLMDSRSFIQCNNRAPPLMLMHHPLEQPKPPFRQLLFCPDFQQSPKAPDLFFLHQKVFCDHFTYLPLDSATFLHLGMKEQASLTIILLVPSHWRREDNTGKDPGFMAEPAGVSCGSPAFTA